VAVSGTLYAKAGGNDMRKNEKERNDFWLELGPVDAFADMGCQAAWDGDASPDGKRRGYTGAQDATVYEPSRAQNCGCGQAQPPQPGERTEEQPRHSGQTPDVNTDNIPAEMPPIPPEAWPGL
jgi:hypothetical protein